MALPLYMHTLLSFISCIGFAVLFNVQRRNVLLAAVNGAISWTLLLSLDVPGICAEVFAIVQKTPATGFIVIGVIPLVPGFRVYKSMLFFVNGDITGGVAEGIHACFIAVAIAVGIILATSLTRLVRHGINDYKKKHAQ